MGQGDKIVGFSEELLDLVESIFFSMIVEGGFILVVKDDSVIEESDFYIWKSLIVYCVLWKFFPIAD